MYNTIVLTDLSVEVEMEDEIEESVHEDGEIHVVKKTSECRQTMCCVGVYSESE